MNMDKINFDPVSNENVISIIKQDDGNYIGYSQKHGKLITERAGDPSSVLSSLITHA